MDFEDINYEKTEKKVVKERPKIHLKIKTLSDFKRFTSKQLHKIVEKFREKNKSISLTELAGQGKYFELMKYAVRQSLIARSARNREKQNEKIVNKLLNKKEQLDELKEVNAINQKQYDRAMEKAEYKAKKKIYEKDLGSADQEKPKNPTVQRAIQGTIKGAKKVANVVKTGAIGLVSIAGAVIAAPFIGLYKGAKLLGNTGKKLLGKGKVAALTVGKVAGNVKEQVQTARGEVNREIYEKASEEKQQEMMEEAYKQAEKENKKREREAARREKLHMGAEQQPIDHEEAKKKSIEQENEPKNEQYLGL